ncbi:hypothetical protein CHS0354_016417 [Potamilus streckersoni]|uniref:Uncharacterized protein n=1 Tax=Potamilus streckersoni TaxID=2493646 RepID=A0AAE0SVF3_9BIVA|nr:hypothetical protein CHS0354_016417 [Potamilus streckersoni]
MILGLEIPNVGQTTIDNIIREPNIVGFTRTTATDGVIVALSIAELERNITNGVQLEIHGNIDNIVVVMQKHMSLEDHVLKHRNVAYSMKKMASIGAFAVHRIRHVITMVRAIPDIIPVIVQKIL